MKDNDWFNVAANKWQSEVIEDLSKTNQEIQKKTKMTNRCDDCKHSKVCMYKREYQEDYAFLKDNFKCNELFSIELKCKEYESNPLIEILKDFEPGMMPLKVSTSCEGCPIYDDIKNGKTVVNDACTFCNKSSIKVTN